MFQSELKKILRASNLEAKIIDKDNKLFTKPK